MDEIIAHVLKNTIFLLSEIKKHGNIDESIIELKELLSKNGYDYEELLKR